DGAGDPLRHRHGADHRDRVLPQPVRPARAAAADPAARRRAAPHPPGRPVPGAHRDRTGLDAVRILGGGPPAAGAGDLAVVRHAAVRDHRRGAVAGRDGAHPPLDGGGGGLRRRAGDPASRHRVHAGDDGGGDGRAVRGRGGDPDQAALALRFARHGGVLHLRVLGADVAAAGAAAVGLAPPTAWLWLVATGVMGTFGQLLWTRALALGEVSALQPISFVQLPVLVAFGWWLFGETIDAWTLAGAAIVLGANGYIAHRETML